MIAIFKILGKLLDRLERELQGTFWLLIAFIGFIFQPELIITEWNQLQKTPIVVEQNLKSVFGITRGGG